MPRPRHTELGSFLRAKRTTLKPTDIGLAGGRRRRTPGLRREEVAALAGIGVDWYIRLEQGRAVAPSAGTVEALASALRLDKAERVHLATLAHAPRRAPFVRETVPDTIRRFVESLDRPAYVTGQRWDVLAWNAAAADVVTDFARMAERDRNILGFMMTDPDARRLFGASWLEEARRMVAQFRPSYDLFAGDPAFVVLVEQLGRDSLEFARWWAAHEIRTSGSGVKRLWHPRRGLLHFEYATFQANDDPALKLAVYTELRVVT